jgi:hypothetical protein
MEIISPHGFSISLNLPKPECSTELNITTASFFSSLFSRKRIKERTYGQNDTNSLRDGLKHTPGIINGRVLVIGSRNPWVEACVLEVGARAIVTLEYDAINCSFQYPLLS